MLGTPVIENINIINRKRKDKSIKTYDVSTLYTTVPHDKLINVTDSVLRVEIEHTFIFPNIMLHTGEKSQKKT